jgi:hypothetical protein
LAIRKPKFSNRRYAEAKFAAASRWRLDEHGSYYELENWPATNSKTQIVETPLQTPPGPGLLVSFPTRVRDADRNGVVENDEALLSRVDRKFLLRHMEEPGTKVVRRGNGNSIKLKLAINIDYSMLTMNTWRTSLV